MEILEDFSTLQTAQGHQRDATQMVRDLQARIEVRGNERACAPSCAAAFCGGSENNGGCRAAGALEGHFARARMRKSSQQEASRLTAGIRYCIQVCYG